MSVQVSRSEGGVRLDLDLERDHVLPGRLAAGKLRLTFERDVEFRGIVAALVATEQWQWTRTDRDANGNTRTRTETERREHQRLPVMLSGPGSRSGGEVVEFPLGLPIPPLGPATFEGNVSRLTWELDIKVDVPGFDPGITADIVVLQPTGLLSAGVIDVAQFALWPSADAAAGDARGAIALDPVPLCIGQPFGGLLSVTSGRTKLQGVRLELRQKIKATVSSGNSEEITLWQSTVAGEGEFGGEQAMAFNGELAPPWLPTIRLPHGRADAQFHVILAKAWAPDIHLVRDVAICSTTEL
jgi:hypothetical protein